MTRSNDSQDEQRESQLAITSVPLDTVDSRVSPALVICIESGVRAVTTQSSPVVATLFSREIVHGRGVTSHKLLPINSENISIDF